MGEMTMLSRRRALLFPFFGAAFIRLLLSREFIGVVAAKAMTAEEALRADSRIELAEGSFEKVSGLYIARINSQNVMGDEKEVLIWHKGRQFQDRFADLQLARGDILLLEIRTVAI